MKKIFILTLLLLLVGCSNDTKVNTPSNNITDTQEFAAESNINTLVKAIEMEYMSTLMSGNSFKLNEEIDITIIDIDVKPESGIFILNVDSKGNVVITLKDIIYGSQICNYENNAATCVKR